MYVRTPRKWISASLFAGAIVAAGGIALWRIPAVQAEDAVVVNGQDAPDLDNYRGGMSAPAREAIPRGAPRPVRGHVRRRLQRGEEQNR